MQYITQLTLGLSLAGLLTACAEQPKTGVAIGPLLQGLHYESDDETGTVDEHGRFMYLEGSPVRFSLGGITLATVEGRSRLAPETFWGASLLQNADILENVFWDEQTSEWDILFNQMLFLAALDSDAVASNGFNLSAWHDRLSQESLNFDQPSYQFVTDTLAEFKARHSLPEDYSLHSLEGLYTASSTPLNLYLRATEMEADSRGVVVTENQYDEQGNKIERVRKYDNDDDGTFDRMFTLVTSYNEQNQETRRYETEDMDNDGRLDAIEEMLFEWDERGLQASYIQKTDENADGHWERTNETSTEYNEHGKRTRVESISTIQNSPTSTRAIYTRHTYYVYDDNNRLLQSQLLVDKTTDGIIDEETIETYQYDEAGRQTNRRRTHDTDFNGIPDRINVTLTSYDAHGRTSVQRHETDSTGDGFFDVVSEYRYVYNPAGYTLESHIFRGNESGVTLRDETRYTRDENNAVLTRLDRQDSAGDGVFETVERTQYDREFTAAGRVSFEKRSVDEKDDGTIDESYAYSRTYNDVGQQLTYLREDASGAELEVDYRETRTSSFDDHFNEIEYVRMIDRGADGEIDTKERHTYTYVANPTSVNEVFEYFNSWATRQLR